MENNKLLLKISREVISSEINNKEFIVGEEIKNKFSENGACFVTLTIDSELRGCIGTISAYQELWKDVIDNSKHAAFHDPRFNPLTKKELSKIKIEISILSKPSKLGLGINVFSKIDNKMGIILKIGQNSATFLPQVWEMLSDKTEFLEHLSKKAGLSKDSWKEAEISYYRVESFKEE